MYLRKLDLSNIISRKSIFLIGPRQVGKSTYLRTLFSHAKYVDLLEAETLRQRLKEKDVL